MEARVWPSIRGSLSPGGQCVLQPACLTEGMGSTMERESVSVCHRVRLAGGSHFLAPSEVFWFVELFGIMFCEDLLRSFGKQALFNNIEASILLG